MLGGLKDLVETSRWVQQREVTPGSPVVLLIL